MFVNSVLLRTRFIVVCYSFAETLDNVMLTFRLSNDIKTRNL